VDNVIGTSGPRCSAWRYACQVASRVMQCSYQPTLHWSHAVMQGGRHMDILPVRVA
jgi:hypothetical protein